MDTTLATVALGREYHNRKYGNSHNHSHCSPRTSMPEMATTVAIVALERAWRKWTKPWPLCSPNSSMTEMETTMAIAAAQGRT